MSRSVSVPSVPEPVLSAEERAAFARGLAQFNDRLFFECHDTLEEIWSGVRGAPREFVQGLIQAAVGFYHLGNGNRGGATTMLTRGLSRLSRYPDRYYGLELDGLRREVAEWQARIAEGGELPGDLLSLPKCRRDPGTAVSSPER